jgi:cleavage stimulation factor subunit 3
VAALRRVFHLALAVPMQQLETVWRTYEEFEAAVQDKSSSADYVKRASQMYQQARGVARERRAQYEPLPRGTLPVPPAANPRALQQVEQWRRILTFEKVWRWMQAGGDGRG